MPLIAPEYVPHFKTKDRGPEAIKWSKEILRLNRYRCILTGHTCVPLAVHHLHNWAQHPDKRFDLDNGVSIRRDLHILFHNVYGYGYNTPEQFDQFADDILALIKDQKLK